LIVENGRYCAVGYREHEVTWRLRRLKGDLDPLLRDAEASLGTYPVSPQRPYWEAIVDIADPLHFAQRHGHWRRARAMITR
jgi:hypothetical protein